MKKDERGKLPKLLWKCFNCGKIVHKNDDCPELVGSWDKAKQSLDKKQHYDLILCTASETICTATEEKKKSINFSNSI